jgi:phosphate-selective porin OprO/OprP
MKKTILLVAALAASPAWAEKTVWPDTRVGDSANNIALHGRFVADAGTGAGDGDATFRRVRLGVNGKFLNDFYYKVENDFAVDNVTDGFTDAYVGYNIRKGLAVKVGQFKEPFSFETLTSSRFATFMERGLTTTFVPGRRVGSMLRSNGQWDDSYWTAAIGVFDGGVGVSRELDDTRDITGRVSFAPIAKQGEVLHVGGAIAYRTPDDATDTISYGSDPESRFYGSDVADTGPINDVDYAAHYGLEAAGIWGPFSLQSEAIMVDVKRHSGAPDAQFNAWYLQASYFLTGESRQYVKDRGTFNRNEPREPVTEGGWGAWQVAARYSALDLTDGVVRGGEANDMTLGLNWYPHRQVAVMGNVVQVNSSADSPSPNDDPTLFMLRVQYDF